MIDKKFLADIGITDEETVKKIVVAYGTDIKSEQAVSEQLRTQLAEANTKIESFKNMDIEGVKKSADDWKAKFEQSEQARKNFEHKTKVGGIVKNLGLRDNIYEDYLINQLIEKQLKFEGEKLIGGDDVIADFKAKYPNAFKSEKPSFDMGGSTNGADLSSNGFNFNFEVNNYGFKLCSII